MREVSKYHIGKKYALHLDCQNDISEDDIQKEPVLAFIEDHLLDYDATEIARYFGYSYDHFRHVFRVVYNISYVSYIRKRRLFHAKQGMMSGESAKEISWRYGFKTESGFYKAYVKEFGCSPKKHKVKLF